MIDEALLREILDATPSLEGRLPSNASTFRHVTPGATFSGVTTERIEELLPWVLASDLPEGPLLPDIFVVCHRTREAEGAVEIVVLMTSGDRRFSFVEKPGGVAGEHASLASALGAWDRGDEVRQARGDGDVGARPSPKARVEQCAIRSDATRAIGWVGPPGGPFHLLQWPVDAFETRRRLRRSAARSCGPIRYMANGITCTWADGDVLRVNAQGNSVHDAKLARTPQRADLSPEGGSYAVLGPIDEYSCGSSFTRDGDEMEEWRTVSRPEVLRVRHPRGSWDISLHGRLRSARWVDETELVVLSDEGIFRVRVGDADAVFRFLPGMDDERAGFFLSPSGEWVLWTDGAGAVGRLRGEREAGRARGGWSGSPIAVADDGLVARAAVDGLWVWMADSAEPEHVFEADWRRDPVKAVGIVGAEGEIAVVRESGEGVLFGV